MNIFDQYLFDEIVESYIQPDLTFEDYEEIYQRFLNLEHIPEVKPYLLSMRFLGLGTEAEPEEVLSELRTHFDSGNVNLCGLYYDMILYKNRNDKEAAEKLSEFENEGYSDNYLKEHSHLNYEEVGTMNTTKKMTRMNMITMMTVTKMIMSLRKEKKLRVWSLNVEVFRGFILQTEM